MLRVRIGMVHVAVHRTQASMVQNITTLSAAVTSMIELGAEEEAPSV